MSRQPGTPRRPRSVVPSPPEENDDEHTGRRWASHVGDPWEPLILTLDGGGIRGYSSLIILQQLMNRVALWENRIEAEEEPDVSKRHKFNEDDLLLCHYFDWIFGTSTGGLIGTMLGRLRMSISQCMEIYRDVGEDLFGHRRSVIPLTTKYRSKPMEKAVQSIVREHCKEHRDQCDGQDMFPWDSTSGTPKDEDWHIDTSVDRICQTICLTATHNGKLDEAFLLRTYDHRYVSPPNWITLYNEGAEQLRIWEVTRATSAAPFFFKVLEADIAGEIIGFKDGGIRENNPAGAAWNEFISLYGEDKEPVLLLSLGTGKPNESRDGFSESWPGPFGTWRITKKVAEKFAVFKNVLIKYTEGEAKHQAMIRLARGEHHWYKRLNVSHGLHNVKLDNWKKGPYRNPKTGEVKVVPGGLTLSRMEETTHAYLNRKLDHQHDTYARPGVMLDQTAQKLVRYRRARVKSRDRRLESYLGRHLSTNPQTPDGPYSARQSV